MKPIARSSVFLALCAVTWFATANSFDRQRTVSDRFKQLTRASRWRQILTFPLAFNTHHPQGLVKIGEAFYLSSVEVTQVTRRFAKPQNGFDRDTGAGIGHLFKFDQSGQLLADLTLGEGTLYHPGGIDFDGQFIWISVAEYRPNSRSIVYRVDPKTIKATEVLRFADHLGGIIHNPENHTLHAVSWGSRYFYRWTINTKGQISQAIKRPNSSFYIDYQDCKYLGSNEMLCGGLSNYHSNKDQRFSLGGLELIDLMSHRAKFQLPLELCAPSGLVMTQNPFWLETTQNGLRAYFIPEDQTSTLYVYDVTP